MNDQRNDPTQNQAANPAENLAALPAETLAEMERLQGRVRKLAEEKSYLQLVLRMIEQINPAHGLHDMVGAMLNNIIETIGGTDIKIWYWIDDEIVYADFPGTRATVAAIDDELASQVAREGKFIELRGDAQDSLLRGGILPGTWTWVFPLEVGDELIGIVKLENVHIIGASLRHYLPIFFSHAALILSNEIRNHKRLKAQEALREKSEELDSYFNSALDLFCIADTEGYFHKLNPSWKGTLGYEISDLEGRRFLDFVHPDDHARTQSIVELLLEQQSIVGFTNRYRHRNGSWRWIEWRAQPRGQMVFAAARDVTEKKEADDALRLAASVFANSQEGIVITDARNRVLDVNEAFCRITGYSREEMLEQDPKLLKSGRQDAAFYAAMWKTLQTHGTWRGEIWNRRKSGEVYAEMLSIDAVRDENGDVQHYVGAFSDISQIKAHQAELERIAHYDPLTGLPNRRLLTDRLHQALARTRRNRCQLAICYLDLDGFKPVNDQLGHDAGDLLLIEFSRRLQEISRAGDTVARLGGDEFILMFCDLHHENDYLPFLERVLAATERPFTIKQQTVCVSASIGVTVFPRDNVDADTLLRHADQAMYQAKEAGKGRYHLFDTEQNRMANANRATLKLLEEAFQKREFVLFYQPKVNMTSGEIIGAEALIRWQHPVRGLLAPAEFLPILAGTELEIAVGEWVIDSALRQLENWQLAGLRLAISVNVSANQLLRTDFTDRLSEILLRHPAVSPDRLELEILESAAIDDLSNASRTLANCVAQGVHLALDDFGTGYSSLTYFRKLPIGTLKIDQAFVRSMLDDPEDLGIIESVIGLAKAFNRPVIAEGVETQEHGTMLMLLGCPLAQGYGIARPMPAPQIPEWIAQWRQQERWPSHGYYALPTEDLPILVARRSFQKWAEGTVQFILDPAHAMLPEQQFPQSPFGRWYYGSGMNRYGHLSEFIDLESEFTRLHGCSRELVRLCQNQEPLVAQARLPELNALAEQVGRDLENLLERVQRQAAGLTGGP